MPGMTGRELELFAEQVTETRISAQTAADVLGELLKAPFWHRHTADASKEWCQRKDIERPDQRAGREVVMMIGPPIPKPRPAPDDE